MSLGMTCEMTHAVLSDYLDGQLSRWQRLRVWLHLLLCPDCRAVLATLKALPGLAGLPEEPPREVAEAALAGALDRLRRNEAIRPWPASPVPADAQDLLAAGPDLPLSILADAHQAVAGRRDPVPGPYHLPKGILDKLPPEDQWRWLEDPSGKRRAELLKDPDGRRLVLAYAPPGARSKAHRHLGSESILVLAGSLLDDGVALAPGEWVHHPQGSTHAPKAAGEACWCLIREEGGVEGAGPLQRLRTRD